MKKLMTLAAALLCTSAAFAQKQEKSFKNLDRDYAGKVYFEKIYNVNRRTNMEILRYAVEFANDNGSPVSPKQIDQERNEASFPFTFRLKKKEDFALGINSIRGIITVGARDEQTRIVVHDLNFTSTGPCTNGTLESLLSCEACSRRNIRNIERWMAEEIGERFYWDYKHFLEEAVTRKRTWN